MTDLTPKFRDKTTFSCDELDSALCAWEIMLDWRSNRLTTVEGPTARNAMNIWWNGYGTSAMRDVAQQAGAICNDVYQHMKGQDCLFNESFDWEFVPAVLARISWDQLVRDNLLSGPVYAPDVGAIFDAMLAANPDDFSKIEAVT